MEKGTGEIIIYNLLPMTALMTGYDIPLIKKNIESRGTIADCTLERCAGKFRSPQTSLPRRLCHGLAAGSFFVYQGIKKGVLINYVRESEINF